MTVSDPAAQVARRAAARLAGDVSPSLPAVVERAIATDGAKLIVRTYDAQILLEVGTLLLSMATFAWAIYRDLKADREKDRERQKERERKAAEATPVREVLRRRLRMEFPVERFPSPEQRDRMMTVVVEEVLDQERSTGER